MHFLHLFPGAAQWHCTQILHLSVMSKGYTRAKAIAGLPCPAYVNKQVWGRYQAVAKDSRLAGIYTHNLPDSYVSLYELTRMPTPLLEAVARSGLLDRRTPYRLLRKIRISGKLPIQLEVWTEPEEVADLELRLNRLKDEFG
jgi:hypothetical protein